MVNKKKSGSRNKISNRNILIGVGVVVLLLVLVFGVTSNQSGSGLGTEGFFSDDAGGDNLGDTLNLGDDASFCGDGNCDADETPDACPMDCGSSGACTDDTNCGPGEVCMGGLCGPDTNTGSCGGINCIDPTPICVASPFPDGLPSCEVCGDASDSPSTGDICANDGSGNACMECLTNTHCSAPNGVCDTTTNTCGECFSDYDCTDRINNAACVANACAPCSNDFDCDTNWICNVGVCEYPF